MQIVKKAEELSRICREWHKAGETVSLVPTMGYYHAGHESLMDRARELGTKLVVSLFVVLDLLMPRLLPAFPKKNEQQ